MRAPAPSSPYAVARLQALSLGNFEDPWEPQVEPISPIRAAPALKRRPPGKLVSSRSAERPQVKPLTILACALEKSGAGASGEAGSGTKTGPGSGKRGPRPCVSRCASHRSCKASSSPVVRAALFLRPRWLRRAHESQCHGPLPPASRGEPNGTPSWTTAERDAIRLRSFSPSRRTFPRKESLVFPGETLCPFIN